MKPVEHSWARVTRAALVGLTFMAVGAAIQAAFGPRMTLSCERGNGPSVDCRLRWHVLADSVPVRFQRVPDLRSVEVRELGGEGPRATTNTSGRKGASASKFLLEGARGTVVAVWFGEWADVMRCRNEVTAFLADGEARTMTTVAPATGPYRYVALGLFLFGAFYWLYLPFQIAGVLKSRRQGARSDESQ